MKSLPWNMLEPCL